MNVYEIKDGSHIFYIIGKSYEAALLLLPTLGNFQDLETLPWRKLSEEEELTIHFSEPITLKTSLWLEIYSPASTKLLATTLDIAVE